MHTPHEEGSGATQWAQIGRRLREARLRMNFSQETLAELAGVNVRSIRRWERGEALPHPHARAQLCTVLGQTSEALVFLATPPAALEEAENAL